MGSGRNRPKKDKGGGPLVGNIKDLSQGDEGDRVWREMQKLGHELMSAPSIAAEDRNTQPMVGAEHEPAPMPHVAIGNTVSVEHVQ